MPNTRYGLPYMGSKNTIAKDIVQFLPQRKNFYDLFAGGCAVCHAALESGKWQNIFANDITNAPKLFKEAITGKCKDKTSFVSRDEFNLSKDDPYIRLCWSFGNNGRNYMYSKDIEEYKRLVHTLIFEEDRQKRYFAFKKVIRHLFSMGLLLARGDHPKGQFETTLKKNIENLKSDFSNAKSLESLESLQISQKSYQKIDIKEDSVVYCDIPYKDTASYTTDFDHNAFYQWAKKQGERQDILLFISEYQMPPDFVCVWQKEKRSVLSSTNNSLVATEKIFVPRCQEQKAKKALNKTQQIQQTQQTQ